MSNDRKKDYFMRVAEETALLSYAEKLKVGAVAVRDNRIICTGYNGTGPGEDNCCEELVDVPVQVEDVYWRPGSAGDRFTTTFEKRLKTKANVTHAERNLIDFAAAEGIPLRGATIFTTHSPCMDCARSIANVGVAEVYYRTLFTHPEGVDYLTTQRNVRVTRLD